VSLALRQDLVSVLRSPAEPEVVLPGTVGGLPGSPPVRYLPVVPEVVVEIEADQEKPAEFGRFRHRPRVVRLRPDMEVQDLEDAP
jgi:hypothetical protein